MRSGITGHIYQLRKWEALEIHNSLYDVMSCHVMPNAAAIGGFEAQGRP